MPVPADGTLASELYTDALAPYAREDAEHDFVLGTFLIGLLAPAQEIADLVRDDPDTGATGWSALVDADRCPVWALPWLAQLVGVRDEPTLSEVERRARIKDMAGLHRGTVAYAQAAAAAYLTGTKTVNVTERDGGAWLITVETLSAETPDPDLVEQALLAAKPAGLLLTYNVV